MSDLERLHQIIDNLPEQQIHALLTLLEPSHTLTEQGFLLRISAFAEEDADEETAARVLAAEAEQGENISHSELKSQLGL